ncbi:MAG: hypothetical protein M3Y64_08485 [Gemmatimonadota bacterium]|nr:hypothetical protein [Gemmatimonadota bacterium]
MSATHVNQMLDELRTVTTKIAWRQWGAIGGSASSKESWQSIVDVEH